MKEIFGDDDCEEIEDERRGNAENDDNSVWNDVQYAIFWFDSMNYCIFLTKSDKLLIIYSVYNSVYNYTFAWMIIYIHI